MSAVQQAGAAYFPPQYRMRGLQSVFNITFWLQVALLASAAWSVQSAGWVDSPPLAVIAFLGALTAFLMADLKGRASVHHASATLAGVLIAYLGGVFLTEADQWYLRFGELNARLGEWLAAIFGRDAAADSLPLSITMIAMVWMISYFTSWMLFKRRNVWAVLLPVGTGVVINLTYLPERFYVHLFIYMFFGLLMLVHVNSLNAGALFRTRGTPYPASLHRLVLALGLLLSAAILGITAAFPLSNEPSAPLERVFDPVDRMVRSLQDEFYRVFAAVPGHEPTSVRFFGTVLPLQRAVPITEDEILFSSARYPLYWPAIAYDGYTGKAWKVEETTPKLAVSVSQELSDEEEEGLAGTIYRVDLSVESPYLMLPGNVLDIKPNANEFMPAFESHSLDIVDLEQNQEMPSDMQELAATLKASAAGTGNPSVRAVPFNIEVTGVVKELENGNRRTMAVEGEEVVDYYAALRRAFAEEGDTVGLEVSRAAQEDSVAYVEPQVRLEKGSQYTVTAEFIYASEEDLRTANVVYPAGILERFLGLPTSLPERVSVLASELMANADNTYDKAVAIETYLREEMEYTTEQPEIPHDADVVDYFLFESKEGFSDFFASSMAVMLRSQGIPSRMVLGFGPGEPDPEREGFVILDKDSHSWPEVYFGELGWVPFEPTPIYPVRTRGRPESPFGIGGLTGDLIEGQLEEILGEPQMDPDSLDTLELDPGGPLPGGDGAPPLPLRYFGTPLGLGGGLFLGFMVVGVVLLRLVWMMQYGRLPTGQTAYERMYRLSAFLGFRARLSQTPAEFTSGLGELLPEVRDEVEMVSQSFVRERYGGVRPTALEQMRLLWAWRRIKRSLSARQMREGEAVPG